MFYNSQLLHTVVGIFYGCKLHLQSGYIAVSFFDFTYRFDYEKNKLPLPSLTPTADVY